MRLFVAVTVLTASLSGAAMAAEFQAVGAMGMGGAGVARDVGAYAPYWNPAGLAFATKSFSGTLGGGVGVRVSEGLADNVDRLAKFTEGSPSTVDKLKNLSITPANSSSIAEIVSLLSVIDDIQTKKGTLSLNANAGLSFQVTQFGVGLYMLSEGYGRPLTDLTNILPSSTNVGSGSSITAANLITLAGTPAASTFFNAAQITQLNTALSTAVPSATDRTNIINALGNSLATPSNTSIPTISAAQATDTFVKVVAPAIGGAATNNINNNQTAILVKNVIFTEVPFSYGHAFDLKEFGKIGVGGSFKVVNGRVYQTRIRLTENGGSVSSDDITDGMKDNYEQSTSVTVDIGAQWKYAEVLTVGLVAKNLTSPSFKSPELKDQNGVYVDSIGNKNVRYREPDVKLKPQARLGLAYSPFGWLSLATDIDLTENETVLAGLVDYKSRHFGGGLELSPFTWFKLRAGMYKNLANSDIGPVATGGITIGIPWVLLEIDGAYGLKEAKYKNEDYPRESKIQAQLVMQF